MRQLKITKSITNRESASLDKYLQEIGREELITVEEEVELAAKIRKGVYLILTLLPKQPCTMVYRQLFLHLCHTHDCRRAVEQLGRKGAGDKIFYGQTVVNQRTQGIGVHTFAGSRLRPRRADDNR